MEHGARIILNRWEEKLAIFEGELMHKIEGISPMPFYLLFEYNGFEQEVEKDNKILLKTKEFLAIEKNYKFLILGNYIQSYLKNESKLKQLTELIKEDTSNYLIIKQISNLVEYDIFNDINNLWTIYKPELQEFITDFEVVEQKDTQQTITGGPSSFYEDYFNSFEG